jgi:hypothetical protein
VAVAPAPVEPVTPTPVTSPLPTFTAPFEVPADATPAPMPTAVLEPAPRAMDKPTATPTAVAAPKVARPVEPAPERPDRPVRPAQPATKPRAEQPTAEQPKQPAKPAERKQAETRKPQSKKPQTQPRTTKPAGTEKRDEVEVITPRPGMRNPKPVRWERVEVLGERKLRVHYAAGVAPCNVLDSVRVDYRPATIVVTLYAGSDPKQTDRVCAAVADEKAVDVRLAKPLAGRKVVDGAAAALTPPAAAPGRSTSEAMQVRPTPGAVQTRTTAWDRAEALGERTVRIWFTTGAPPCSVLDRVKVDYAADAVTITLITGRSRAAAGQACMTALRPAYVDVTLTEALAGRQIRDGSKA